MWIDFGFSCVAMLPTSMFVGPCFDDALSTRMWSFPTNPPCLILFDGKINQRYPYIYIINYIYIIYPEFIQIYDDNPAISIRKSPVLQGDPGRPRGLHLLLGQLHGLSQAPAPSGLSAGAQQVELGQRSGRLGTHGKTGSHGNIIEYILWLFNIAMENHHF